LPSKLYLPGYGLEKCSHGEKLFENSEWIPLPGSIPECYRKEGFELISLPVAVMDFKASGV